MRRPDHRRWALWLLALLLAPAVLALTGRRPNDIRADQAPPAPGFDSSRMLDEEYFREVDAFLADRLSIRGAGLWARAMVDYELFGEPGNNVVAGTGGWLYWLPYLQRPCDELADLSVPSTPTVAPGRLRIVIAAPKAAVHPEPLGSIRPCEVEARATWSARMIGDRRYLDVNGPLDRFRERQADAELFYRRDTHWSPLGRLVIARTLVNGLQSGLWDESALQPVEGEPFVEGLLQAIGIQRSVTLGDREVHRSVDPVVVTDQPSDTKGLRGVYETTMDGDDPVVDGTTLIVGDSQLDYVVPYVAPYFEHLVFVQSRLVDVGYDLAQHQPDRILVESIEFSASERLTPELMQQLTAALEPDRED